MVLTKERSNELDVALMAAGSGSLPGFDRVHQISAPLVLAVARRILGDAHLAEEVSQEVFLDIWRTSTRFDAGKGTARAWILTLAHSRTVDRVRSTQSARDRDTSYTASSIERPYDSTSEGVIHAERRREVSAVVMGLSAVQQQAIQLAYYQGLTMREISELLDVPLGTIKSRVRDALIRLRRLDPLPW